MESMFFLVCVARRCFACSVENQSMEKCAEAMEVKDCGSNALCHSTTYQLFQPWKFNTKGCVPKGSCYSQKLCGTLEGPGCEVSCFLLNNHLQASY